MDTATDDAPSGNMTAEADAHQALPGVEAIPADMPDSPHGDISLEYSLQNFNALVAANTAMETALADGALRESALEARIGELKDALALQQQHAGEARSTHMERKDLLLAANKRADEMQIELDFAREQTASLQRRLDRSLGYLDRVLDDEDSIRSGETRTVPAPKPPVGPAFGEIPDAVRRRPNTATDASWMIPGERISFDDGTTSRRRRY